MCVSHPGSKGFPRFHLSTAIETRTTFSTLFHAAGACGLLVLPTTQRSCGQEGEAGTDHPCVPTDHPCVPATTFEQAVQFDRFVFMVLHVSTPETLVLQLSCTARAPPLRFAVKGNRFCSNTYKSLDFSPYRSLTFLPIVAIESN